MNNSTLLIFAGVGLAAYWLYKTSPHTPGGTVTQPVAPQAPVVGMYNAPQTPRDPGDVNNWLPGLITGLAGTATAIAGAVNRDSSSSTPSGWSDPSW